MIMFAISMASTNVPQKYSLMSSSTLISKYDKYNEPLNKDNETK